MKSDVPAFRVTDWKDDRFWEIEFDEKICWAGEDGFHKIWFVAKERCPDRIALFNYVRERASGMKKIDSLPE